MEYLIIITLVIFHLFMYCYRIFSLVTSLLFPGYCIFLHLVCEEKIKTSPPYFHSRSDSLSSIVNDLPTQFVFYFLEDNRLHHGIYTSTCQATDQHFFQIMSSTILAIFITLAIVASASRHKIKHVSVQILMEIRLEYAFLFRRYPNRLHQPTTNKMVSDCFVRSHCLMFVLFCLEALFEGDIMRPPKTGVSELFILDID